DRRCFAIRVRFEVVYPSRKNTTAFAASTVALLAPSSASRQAADGGSQFSRFNRFRQMHLIPRDHRAGSILRARERGEGDRRRSATLVSRKAADVADQIEAVAIGHADV